LRCAAAKLHNMYCCCHWQTLITTLPAPVLLPTLPADIGIICQKVGDGNICRWRRQETSMWMKWWSMYAAVPVASILLRIPL